MKFIRSDFHLYRNEQWFQFFTEFKRLVEQYGADNLNITELFAIFLVFYTNADEALEIIRKSANTELIYATDCKRDHTFRGLVDAIKSFQQHYDPEKQQAALKIQIILDHYGNIAKLPNDEETASIYNFIQELRQSYRPQIDLLGLQEWLDELEKENNDFQSLTTERNDEQAAKTKLRVFQIRKDGDATYRKIVKRIEAFMLINGEKPYIEFINKLNNFITHYNNLIAQRKGRIALKKKGKRVKRS